MMKILLADSHGAVLGKDQTSANLSLLYLASYLKKYSEVDAEFMYIPQAKSAAHHLKMIREFSPEIYAVSFTSFTALRTYRLINTIKQEFPSVLIVCGGPHATHAPNEVLQKSATDICVIGEGEQTFLEIVVNYRNIENKRASIKGIAFKEDGKVIKTATRELISDLDNIPFPLRSLVNNDDYCGLTYSRARPNTEMVVTRGCPQRCVFCANPVFRLESGPLFRSRSPKNIAEEARELYMMGYREIYIHSDELNVKLDWSIGVCRELANLGFKDLYFQCNMRVLPMSEELAYWMKKANFWLVRIGLETTSNRVLTGIMKKMTFDNTEKACVTLRSKGIKILAFTMLFNYWEENGKLQHETLQEVQKTIKDVYKLWRKGLVNYTSWAFACPVQGSELYDIARRKGMIDEEYYPGDTWNTFDFLNGISKNEFNKVYASARRQQALMAFFSGNIEWRNYKGISRKALTMFRGKPKE